MKIYSLYNRFVGIRKDLDLQKKWWHRLLKVIFITFLGLLLPFSYYVSMNSVYENSTNISVITNLRDYTKTSSEDNSIQGFLSVRGSTACLNGNELHYFSEYILSSEGVCNIDMTANIDKVVGVMRSQQRFQKFNTEEIRSTVLNELQNGKERRYCYMPVSLDCESKNVVKYYRNYIYYLKPVLLSFLATSSAALLMQILYYRGLIYVIFGSKKDLVA
jgi:hypothetical protein